PAVATAEIFSRKRSQAAAETTCTCQGCVLQFEGAVCATSNTSFKIASGTGSLWKALTERRFRAIVAKTWNVSLSLMHPPATQRRLTSMQRWLLPNNPVRPAAGQYGHQPPPDRPALRAPSG